MLSLLICLVLASKPEEKILVNEVLAVTAKYGAIRDKRGIKIFGMTLTKVDMYHMGYRSGLKVGDHIIAVTSYNVLHPHNLEYTPINADSFLNFPSTSIAPPIAQIMLVHRPSIGRTEQLPVYFAGGPAFWPMGELGIVLEDFPQDPIKSRNRNIEYPVLDIVRVHPYTLGERYGLRPKDCFESIAIIRKTKPKYICGHPDKRMFEQTLHEARCDKEAVSVNLAVRRGLQQVEINIPIDELR